MNELLDPNLLRRFQEDVGSVHIGVSKGIRVTEAQIDVGLRRKVEDGIDVVSLQAVHDLGGVCNIAMVEGEVALVIEDSGVVERGAVVELVKRDNVVCVRVG